MSSASCAMCGAGNDHASVEPEAGRPLLLVVDDDATVLRDMERLAETAGFDVMTCARGADAMRTLMRRPADLAMIDLGMTDIGGLDLLRRIRATLPGCGVILTTGYTAGLGSAVEAIKLGAREYLTKPFDLDRVRQVLHHTRTELERRAQVLKLEGQVASQMEFFGMVGRSPWMQEASSLIQRLAPHARAVLITGETGTGKELAAHAFHQAGPRHLRPFVTVNCSAMVDALFESELFGHVAGAFPGAGESQPGLIEAADGGTLFLDELGELPLSAQGNLLRVVETDEVRRVGSLQPRKIDVVIVASTSRDLKAEVAAGRFRSDLYYRLNVAGIALPPLRDRRDDIPYLTAAFIRDCARRLGKPLAGITPKAERMLAGAQWDGNVRELKNAIERACMLAEGSMISERELSGVCGATPQLRAVARPVSVARGMGGVPVPLDDLERDHIVGVLQQVKGNRMAAAKMLGISRRALYRRLDRHRIGQRTLEPPAGPQPEFR